MEIEYLCTNLSSLFNIPLRLFEKNEYRQTFWFNKFNVDPVIEVQRQIFDGKERCRIIADKHFWNYGIIKYGDYCLALGPIGNFNLPLNEKRSIFFMLSGDSNGFEEFWECLSCIEKMPLQRFAQLICLINYQLNGEMLKYYELYLPNLDLSGGESAGKSEAHEVPSANTSIYYERDMLEYVKAGDVDGLKSFLTHRFYGTSGKSSTDILRQTKNDFNSAATVVSRAAISAGVNTETALRLSDNYMQQCEISNSIEGIYQMMYAMVVDYTERVRINSGAASYSRDIQKTMRYIAENLTEEMSDRQIADNVYLSVSQLRLKFKQETGNPIHKYILTQKIKEAKILLKNTDKSLIQITYYLNFSSQSHFQNTFKSITGMTPKKYREQNRI